MDKTGKNAKPAPKAPAKPAPKAPAKPAPKPAPSKGKDLAVRPPKAPTDLSTDLASRLARDSGAGMEGTDRESFAIPFIKVVQDGSPQVKVGKVGYNPDAAPGMLVNTVTGELIDGEDGIIILPCAYQRRFIQWGPRGGEGSGYKGEWLPEKVTEALASGKIIKSEDDGKLYIGPGTNPKKDDRVADTRNHFVLVLTENGPVQALLSLTSTQIKKSKQLMGILSALSINGKTPPTWMSKIRITVPAVQESNDQGSWFGVRVEHAGFIEDPALYDAGQAFHDICVQGKAKVNYDEAGDVVDDDEEGDGGF